MLQGGELAVVGEDHAEEGQINDNFARALSGDPEGVINGFAQDEDIKAAKDDG